MKKITLLFVAMVCSSLTAFAQFTFPTEPGPVIVSDGTPVIVSLNDVANAAGVTPGTYFTFSVTADWENLDNAWSSEARLSVVTAAGATTPAAATAGASDTTASTTLTFDGLIAGPYDPSTDGLFELSLTRTFTSDAQWTNIVVSIAECTSPAGTGTAVDDCGNSQFFIDVDVTDLGTATSVTIDNDAGVGATTGVNATGVTQVGPFPAGTPVVISLINEQDGSCTTALAPVGDGCPPPNDTCANAIDVACDETVSGDTSNPLATDTVGNPGADLWYSYSGAAGDITASLCGSGYDTLIRVFDSCGGSEIASNDDSCGLQSQVTFTADGTSTYYIAVEGFNTSEGAFDLSITCAITIPPPSNDECVNAEPLALLVPANGTTAGATEDGTHEKPGCDPFGTIADVWYSFTLPVGTNTLNVTTTPSGTSTEANLAIYPNNCAIVDANILACNDLGGIAGESLTISGTAGTTYLIRVWSDGIAARTSVGARVEGTFTVVADATLSVESFENDKGFTYFPNPVKNELTLNSQKDIQSVAIFNVLGQEVVRTAPNTISSVIDMKNLSTGAYFVRVTIDNVTETVRIIKQ